MHLPQRLETTACTLRARVTFLSFFANFRAFPVPKISRAVCAMGCGSSQQPKSPPGEPAGPEAGGAAAESSPADADPAKSAAPDAETTPVVGADPAKAAPPSTAAAPVSEERLVSGAGTPPPAGSPPAAVAAPQGAPTAENQIVQREKYDAALRAKLLQHATPQTMRCTLKAAIVFKMRSRLAHRVVDQRTKLRKTNSTIVAMPLAEVISPHCAPTAPSAYTGHRVNHNSITHPVMCDYKACYVLTARVCSHSIHCSHCSLC